MSKRKEDRIYTDDECREIAKALNAMGDGRPLFRGPQTSEGKGRSGDEHEKDDH
jgi:hypothetical protein